MRVLFGELSLEEQRERERVVGISREVWQLVRDREDARAQALLVELDGRLALDVNRSGGLACVQLCAGDVGAWPLARFVLEQAPRSLDVALALGRPALSLEQALAEVENEFGVELRRATLRAGFGRGHLLDLTLGVPGGSNREIEQIAAENLVRAVLGDRLFETWIGAVNVSVEPRLSSLRVLDVRTPRSKLQLNELFDTVAAAARGVLNGLPEESFAARVSSSSLDEWAMLEVEPTPDAPTGRKEDLLLASTCTPELLRCFLDGMPCSSQRFSRVGEHFVFVSYPDAERDMKTRVARRSEIEESLSRELRGVAAITGVGLGVSSTYVDLALCNLETGLPRLVSKLRALSLPRDSFVAFVDTELCEEWVAI